MNTYGTSAICPCCGKTLYTSNIPKYSFVCKDCNKNFYTKEVKDTFAEYWDEVTESTKQLWEINIPVAKENQEKMVFKWKELAKKYSKEKKLTDIQVSTLLQNNKIIYPLWWENIKI